jgi:hypothetical protein
MQVRLQCQLNPVLLITSTFVVASALTAGVSGLCSTATEGSGDHWENTTSAIRAVAATCEVCHPSHSFLDSTTYLQTPSAEANIDIWCRYKVSLDPTIEDVKKLCLSCRRNAKGERVLLHYNGHGVPRPTANGEVWVFNKSYTQYIPLSVYDLQTWAGMPSIYVFDCSAAGVIIGAFLQVRNWLRVSSGARAASLPLGCGWVYDSTGCVVLTVCRAAAN